MEKIGKNSVINELTQGREVANELKKQLHDYLINNPKDDQSSHHFLVEKILSCYDNALSLLNCMVLLQGNQHHIRNDGSDDSNDIQVHKAGSDVSKKRKTLPRWSEQVRVCSGTGTDGQVDDGYNWRKYGQKDILGSNHPRAYYRCSHRNTQGCLATKQVQRADEDPALIFEVIYKGHHTCFQERLKRNKENHYDCNIQKKEELNIMISNEPEHDEAAAVVNQVSKQECISSSFSFLPPTATTEDFSKPPTNYSPPPAESYFSLSPCQPNQFDFEDLQDFLIDDQVGFNSYFMNDDSYYFL